MDKMKSHAVVEFDEVIDGKKMVELIPISWLRDNDSLCFWPPKSKIKEVQKLAEQEHHPTAGWNKYPVKVICKARNYEQGLRRLQKSFKKRDIASSDSELENRKQGQPLMLNSSDVAAALSSSRQPLRSQTNTEKEDPNLNFSGTEFLNSCSFLNNSEFDEILLESGTRRAATTPKLTAAQHIELDAVQDFRSLALYLQGVIEKEFKCWRQSLNLTMHDKFQKMLKTMQYSEGQPDKQKAWISIGENLPFDDLKNFVDFDECLKRDETKKAALNDIFRMVTAGLTDCEDDVREIMKKLISKNVQLQYSGCGKKIKGVGKRSFRETETFKEVEKFLMAKYIASKPKMTVLTLVSRFLSGAKDREGGRALREKPNF